MTQAGPPTHPNPSFVRQPKLQHTKNKLIEIYARAFRVVSKMKSILHSFSAAAAAVAIGIIMRLLRMQNLTI